MMTDAMKPREREVVRLLAQGMRPAEIAEHMGLRRQTVYTYMAAARRALGHETTLQLVTSQAAALQDR